MSAHADGYELRLLGAWSLRRDDRSVRLQLREQRVLAVLGLRGPQSRGALAGLLWPESPEDRARSNLRTSLVRLRRALGEAIATRRDGIGLSDAVAVDVTLVRSVLDMVETAPEEVAAEPVSVLRVLRAPDLLTGWYDDWVLEERERLRHRRFRALERLARVSLADGRPADGVGFAEEAVRLEPLLESAVSLHIRALIDDGDLTAALQEYRRFRERIRAELGVGPPRALTEMLLTAKAERAGAGAGLALDRGRL